MSMSTNQTSRGRGDPGGEEQQAVITTSCGRESDNKEDNSPRESISKTPGDLAELGRS